MKRILSVSLLLLAVLAFRDWSHSEIVHPPGVLVSSTPRQVDIQPSPILLHEGYRLTKRAQFTVEARVLSRENYRWDSQSDLSPVDLALGWGVMSDQEVLDRITIRQGARWYFTRYDLPAPIPDTAIINNSSNMHMVPANPRVLKKLRKVRRGEILVFKGYLVDVDHDSGFRWRTSMRRDDTGNGSCEIFYLEQIFAAMPE